MDLAKILNVDADGDTTLSHSRFPKGTGSVSAPSCAPQPANTSMQLTSTPTDGSNFSFMTTPLFTIHPQSQPHGPDQFAFRINPQDLIHPKQEPQSHPPQQRATHGDHSARQASVPYLPQPFSFSPESWTPFPPSMQSPDWTNSPFPVPTSHDIRLTRITTSDAPTLAPRAMLNCTACMEELPVMNVHIMTTCQCIFCKQCLNRAFMSGCRNLGTFPPKCCGYPLRVGDWRPLLEEEIIARYKDLERERTNTKLLYCAVATCSSLIPPDRLLETQGIGACPICNTYTCTRCRRDMIEHDGASESVPRCPEVDRNTAALYDLSRRRKWRQCPSCSTMVERTEGCDHMDCTCGTEFCYSCGSNFDQMDECQCDSSDHDPDPDPDPFDRESSDEEVIHYDASLVTELPPLAVSLARPLTNFLDPPPQIPEIDTSSGRTACQHGSLTTSSRPADPQTQAWLKVGS